MTTLVDELGEAVRAVAERTATGVLRLGGRWRGGSGIVLDGGRVLTNAHHVHGDVQAVELADGRSLDARALGVDAEGDVAVLALDEPAGTALPWAPDGAVGLGSAVFAVTAGADGPRVTFGLVSGVQRAFRGPRGRSVRGSIEHTAAMAPGSSGSALVDATGRLVGINTHRLEGGLYLAIPADAALRARVDALGRGEAPRRPRLGVAVAPPWAARRMLRAVGLPERDGLLVREVDPDGPAAAAGITTGDLIVTAAGRPMTGVDDLADALAALGDATSLALGVVRGADERSVTVEVGAG